MSSGGFSRYEEVSLSNKASKTLQGSGFIMFYGPAAMYTSSNQEIYYYSAVNWMDFLIPFISGNIIKNTNSNYTSKFKIWYI